MPSSSEVESMRKAAEQGLADAQFNLGNMYAKGEGVPKDAGKGVAWYRKAAEQGLAGAQFNLGLAYAKGEGTSNDVVQAHMWFNLAGSSGYEKARENRRKVETQMTKEQVAEAEKLAREWYEAHRGAKP